MRKIATKIKLDNLTEGTLALKNAGIKLGPEFYQFDRVFLPAGYEQVYGSAEQTPKLILRTDTVNGKESYSLIMKRSIGDRTIIFFQTQVYNFSQTGHIITQIGYEFYGDVDKVRRQSVSGSITISVDKLPEDQWFLKVEQILPMDQTGSVNELDQVLKSLELKHEPLLKEYIELIRGVK